MNAPVSTEDVAAFPSGDFLNSEPTRGITKRELFAAMAMQGLVAAGGHNPTEHDHVAHWAVKQADALLAALDVSEKNHGEG